MDIITAIHPIIPVSEDFIQQLPKRIIELRKKSGLTQAAVAEQLDISKGRYNHYERGIRFFPLKFLPKLSEVLGCAEADFFVSEQPKSSKRGPTSRLDLIVNRIHQLPRTKQAMILDMVEGALDKAS